MNYTYSATQYCNPDTATLDIFDDLINGQLNFICYHVTSSAKYPFVQIMLESAINQKSGKEHFIFPSVTIKKNDSNIANILLKRIVGDLKKLRCKTDSLIEANYKGIFSDTTNKMYALFDISSVDITCLHLFRITPTWFVLPIEIINNGHICDIPVSDEVRKLFTYIMPELGILYKDDIANEPYMLPDIAYTVSDFKTAEFQTLFGPSKKDEHYTFYNSFLDSIISNSDTGINAVNRYALFLDNPNESQSKLLLTREYEAFQPLSFHTLISNEPELESFSNSNKIMIL
jgi:hypothetical protein